MLISPESRHSELVLYVGGKNNREMDRTGQKELGPHTIMSFQSYKRLCQSGHDVFPAVNIFPKSFLSSKLNSGISLISVYNRSNQGDIYRFSHFTN